MKRLSESIELISLEPHGEFYLAQFAHNGQLSEAFWEHRSIRDRYPDEDSFITYMTQRSAQMLAEFGDVRLRGPISQLSLEGIRV